MMERFSAGFDSHSFAASADVPTAARCQARTVKPQGQNKSTRRSGSLFQQLQQRSIHGGRLLDQRSNTIQLLSRLEQHQLLLNRESCALARAVLARECHIEPQQCKLSKNIDALRLFSAFLRIMEKSPGLKTALSQMICQASSGASLAGRNAEQLPDPIEQLVTLNSHLKSILANLQDQHSSDPGVARSLLKETISSVRKLRTIYFPEALRHTIKTGAQKACFPFGNDLKSTDQTVAEFSSKLANTVAVFNRAIAYQQRHERLDWLDMHTVLRPEPAFMALLQIISYLRIPDEQIPSLDGLVDIHSLFKHSEIYGKSDFKHLTSRLTTLWVLTRNAEQLSPDDVGVSTHPLWVNYLGGCHLELLHFPLREELMALSSLWLGDSLASLRDRMIQRHEFNPGRSAVSFGSGTIKNIVFAQRFDLTALYFLLTGCSASKDSYILSDCMLQHLLNGSYTRMNGIERFMSLVIRSGLEFVLHGLMLHKALYLRCPACEFLVELRKFGNKDNVAHADPTVIVPFFTGCSEPSQEDIEHIQQCMLNIMRLHQAQRWSCTVAGALNVQQLLYEIARESGRETSPDGPPSSLNFTPATPHDHGRGHHRSANY